MSLFEQDINTIKSRLKEGIKRDLLRMMQQRVPIDTETLKDNGLKVTVQETANDLVFDCFVDAVTLSYGGRKSIKADFLGLILDVGVRQNAILNRSRSQPANPRGSPTAGWFTQDFVEDVEKYLRRKEFEKWLN